MRNVISRAGNLSIFEKFSSYDFGVKAVGTEGIRSGSMQEGVDWTEMVFRERP
jgi:hypothetical protein